MQSKFTNWLYQLRVLSAVFFFVLLFRSGPRERPQAWECFPDFAALIFFSLKVRTPGFGAFDRFALACDFAVPAGLN